MVLTVIALLWGAFAFGAVYPWAYTPLLVGCLILGVTGLMVHDRAGAGVVRPLSVGALGVGLAVAVQLVPFPRSTLASISPAADVFLRQYELAYAATASPHPLSIQPAATWLGLFFFGALSLFFLGTIRSVSVKGPVPLVRSLLILGALLSLSGIIQKPIFEGEIFGFWRPQYGGNPFGPFVNRNHFAGWMIMVLPLALGYLCARVSHRRRGARRDHRSRVLWLASKEVNELILIAATVLTMSLSLVLTMSRSGITCFAVILTVMACVVATRHRTKSHAVVGAAFVLSLLFVVVGRVGAQTILQRFAAADWSQYNGRIGLWHDAFRVVHAFPWTGSGLNTYGFAMFAYQTVDPTGHTVEAHNDYLQLAAEGGVLVFVPALVLVALFVREVWRRFRERRDDGMTSWLRMGAVTGLVAIAVQETVDFSLQVPGNAALFCVLAAVAVHQRVPPRAPRLTEPEVTLAVTHPPARNA